MKIIKLGKQEVIVDEKVYSAFKKMQRKNRYLKESDKAHDVIYIGNFGMGGSGERGNWDNVASDTNVEKIAEAKFLINLLQRAMKELNSSEREIIQKIFFENITMAEIAKEQNLSHSCIRKRRDTILQKIKIIMEKNL